MGLYLRLQRLQLVRLVRDFELVLAQDEVVDRLHHKPEAARERTDLIRAVQPDVNIELTGLNAVRIAGQLPDG
ncbi:hypothetical protein D3C84_924640 [compost metagenome]